MARPAAEILDKITHTDGTDWYILAAPSVYVLTYQDKPINIKTVGSSMSQYVKYKKVAYATEGSARTQAKRLNKIFQTSLFGYRSQIED